MSQISGSWSAELDTTRLAEEIAQRTAIIVVGMLRAAPGDLSGVRKIVDLAGTDTYEREQDPDPASRSAERRGARFGAVTDDGVQHDPS